MLKCTHLISCNLTLTTEKENYSLDEYLHVQTFTMDGYTHTHTERLPALHEVTSQVKGNQKSFI